MGPSPGDPETQLVVFYYASHGAQLDWRNYLLPVDAVVEQPEHLKQRCIDLNLLLAQFSAKDKTFIIILDACRNNPFGTSYQPEAKGLSQFDAPVGSLLAYATAPGTVAQDGTGENGLYTANLVRELSRRDTRIEDALKRVRLNAPGLRREQIPWKPRHWRRMCSFWRGAEEAHRSRDEEMVEAELTEWARIKNSRTAADWVAYLQAFPNGHFAEIAQARLNRILAGSEKSASPTPAGAAAPTIVRIQTEAQYDALPPGGTYIDPQGNTRREKLMGWQDDTVVQASRSGRPIPLLRWPMPRWPVAR